MFHVEFHKSFRDFGWFPTSPSNREYHNCSKGHVSLSSKIHLLQIKVSVAIEISNHPNIG